MHRLWRHGRCARGLAEQCRVVGLPEQPACAALCSRDDELTWTEIGLHQSWRRPVVNECECEWKIYIAPIVEVAGVFGNWKGRGSCTRNTASPVPLMNLFSSFFTLNGMGRWPGARDRRRAPKCAPAFGEAERLISRPAMQEARSVRAKKWQYVHV